MMKQAEIRRFEQMYGTAVFWYLENISRNFYFSLKHPNPDDRFGYVHSLFYSKEGFHTISPYKMFRPNFFPRLRSFRDFANKQWILLPKNSNKESVSVSNIKKRGFGLLTINESTKKIEEFFKPKVLKDRNKKSVEEMVKEFKECEGDGHGLTGVWFGKVKNGRIEKFCVMCDVSIGTPTGLALSMNMSRDFDTVANKSLRL